MSTLQEDMYMRCGKIHVENWINVVTACNATTQRLHSAVVSFLDVSCPGKCVVEPYEPSGNSNRWIRMKFVDQEKHYHYDPNWFTGLTIIIIPELNNKDQIECGKTKRPYVPSVYNTLLLRENQVISNDHFGYHDVCQFNSLLDLLGHIQKMSLLEPKHFDLATQNVESRDLTPYIENNKKSSEE